MTKFIKIKIPLTKTKITPILFIPTLKVTLFFIDFRIISVSYQFSKDIR